MQNVGSAPKNPVDEYFAGKIKRYQYILFTSVFACLWPMFWHMLSLIFWTPPMNYTCKDGGGDKLFRAINQCPCKNIEWDRSVFTNTFQTKFGIICERDWLISFSQSMIYVGALCGALSFGVLSDRFGRLLAFAASALLLAVSGTLLRFMPTAETFVVVRVIEGAAVGGSIVTSYVFIIEFCSIGDREIMTALYHIPLNLGHMSLPTVSYFLRDCDDFQLAISIPVFLCCIIYFFTYESPKWLVDKRYQKKAIVVMEKIAKCNNESPAEIKHKLESYFAAGVTTKKIQKVSFSRILKYRKVTINLVCMCFIYFTCGMGYYGVSQYIGKMGGDIHMNVTISGALLIPGTIASCFLLKWCGRKSFLMSTTFLSGILMIIVVVIPRYVSFGQVAVAWVCNCFFFISFITVFLYGVELFPTVIRNSVLGVMSLMSRLGQIVAPLINSLPETYAGIAFGVLAIIGGILCIPLPETKGIELPSTLEESNQPAKPSSLRIVESC